MPPCGPRARRWLPRTAPAAATCGCGPSTGSASASTPDEAASEDDEIRRPRVEPLDAVGGHGDDVLDAGAPPTGEVDPRLDAEGHAGLDGQVVARDDVRLLVAVEADA